MMTDILDELARILRPLQGDKPDLSLEGRMLVNGTKRWIWGAAANSLTHVTPTESISDWHGKRYAHATPVKPNGWYEIVVHRIENGRPVGAVASYGWRTPGQVERGVASLRDTIPLLAA